VVPNSTATETYDAIIPVRAFTFYVVSLDADATIRNLSVAGTTTLAIRNDRTLTLAGGGGITLAGGATVTPDVNGPSPSRAPLRFDNTVGSNVDPGATVELATSDWSTSGRIELGAGAMFRVTDDFTTDAGALLSIDLSLLGGGPTPNAPLDVDGALRLDAPGDSLALTGGTPGQTYLLAHFDGPRAGVFDNVSAGYAITYDDAGHNVLATVVPEPGALAVTATAVTAVILASRARRLRA
jgi:hypothetical protein